MEQPSALSSVAPEIAKQFEQFVDIDADGPSQTPTQEREAAAVARPEVDDDETEDDQLGVERDEDEDEEPDSSEEESEDEESEDEDSYVENFSDLAEMLGVGETELLNLQIAGNDGNPVTLAEAISQYRSGPQLDDAMRAEVESTRRELQQQTETAVSKLEQATAQIIQKIQKHQEPPGGWDMLRQQDPAEYIRLRELQEADHRDARAALAALEENAARAKADWEKRHEEYIKQQANMVYRLRPEWTDPKVGQAAFSDIDNYLQRTGFSREQIESLEDALSIVTVWKAAQYDKLAATKPQLRKRLRRLPAKHLRVSARDEAAPQRERAKKRQATLDKFRQSGRIQDAVTLFEEHL